MAFRVMDCISVKTTCQLNPYNSINFFTKPPKNWHPPTRGSQRWGYLIPPLEFYLMIFNNHFLVQSFRFKVQRFVPATSSFRHSIQKNVTAKWNMVFLNRKNILSFSREVTPGFREVVLSSGVVTTVSREVLLSFRDILLSWKNILLTSREHNNREIFIFSNKFF